MDENSLDISEQIKIYALPLMAVILGLIVSFVLYWQLLTTDERRINEHFSRLAQEQSKQLQWNLENYRNALHSAVDLFNSTDRVELNDFRRIAKLIENRYPEVLALEWLPKVSNDERKSFVNNIRQQYDIDYNIKELSASGRIKQAGNREIYYPVTYVQPFQSAPHNRKFLGFDHFSRKLRRKSISKARNQGSITITPSTVFFRTGSNERMIQSPENNLGVILYKPVFETFEEQETSPDQYEKPVGVIALSLKIQSVMNPVFGKEGFQQNVAIFEHPSNPNNPQSRLIYSNLSPENVDRIAQNESKISFSERFPVSDRSWSVLLWPTEEYKSSRGSWAPLLAFGFGLLFTGVLTQGAYWLSGEFLGRRKEFHSIIDSAKDAIISTDKSGEIKLWNAAAEEIFYFKRENIVGESITKILAESERNRFFEVLEKYGRSTEDKIAGEMMEFEGLRENGEQFPIELTISKWRRQGGIFFTIIVRDVTERKRRENKLEELTRNLESKVKDRTEELEQFVYAASHDLREPARVMETYAGFLEEDLANEPSTDVKKDLRFIRDSASQMNELIDSLLSLSRIGQENLQKESVDLNECLDQALEQQEELLATNDVDINRESLPTIQADPALLTDLYQNLISNAIKHGGNGSVRITFTAEKDGSVWILGVKDEGPGIDPEYQDKIFEPFKHLNKPGDNSGTGIGLSICRRIVERHDGTLWVESEPGQGAHFKFTLNENI